jgi:L-lactate dehydrogenase (cytochrome)
MAQADLTKQLRGLRPLPACVRHVGDLRDLARRRLPRIVFDYLDGGSFDELTLRANEADLAALTLRQRGLVDNHARSARTTIAGRPAAAPLALAPIGLTGVIASLGELRAARAAESFGVPYCLSTFATCSLEDIASATASPFMFQLYIFKDRGVNEALVERARAADCFALVVTIDSNVLGRRHRDARNGLTLPLRWTVRMALDCASRPAWSLDWLANPRKVLGNIAPFVGENPNLGDCSAWVEDNFKGSYDIGDLEWLRSVWPGKLIVKGILDPDEARLALDLGADAIVVSNHGGRQLDSAPSSISALAAIREKVAGDTEIIFDGGIRTGLDVLKALGLGARSCLIGRAYAFGLAVAGEAGVHAALRLIAEELDLAMGLTGVRDVTDLPDGLVH